MSVWRNLVHKYADGNVRCWEMATSLSSVSSLQPAVLNSQTDVSPNFISNDVLTNISKRFSFHQLTSSDSSATEPVVTPVPLARLGSSGTSDVGQGLGQSCFASPHSSMSVMSRWMPN